MAVEKEAAARRREETRARLTAPAHIVNERFEEHHRIEGYFEDRSAQGMLGCDRLLKWDSVYGTLQLGYDARRRESFLFANIKTSILDYAPSRDQRQMNDRQRMAQQKTGNQNRAFTARRRGNSAVLLYKAENRPWGEQSVAPYLRRVNLEALRKTMPFLDVTPELAERAEARALDRELMERERRGEDRAGVRARRLTLSRELDDLNALLWRKRTRSLHFFRRVNLAFDWQKQKMFAYYRNIRAAGPARAAEAAAAPPKPKEEDDK